jgi:DNA mismatch repair protein MutS
MMKQYLEIKSQYQDCLLFFRAGDFYELFLEDAHIGARVLNITLTSKSGEKWR